MSWALQKHGKFPPPHGPLVIVVMDGVGVGRMDAADAVHAARTPTLDSIDLESFTISARFKVSEYDSTFRPVFVAGGAWRWAGVRLESDSTVTLMYNDGGTVHTDVVYTLDTWHEAAIAYDGATVELFFDGTKEAEKEATLITGDRRQVSTDNSGNGHVFKGIFGGLKIYSTVVEP